MTIARAAGPASGATTNRPPFGLRRTSRFPTPQSHPLRRSPSAETPTRTTGRDWASASVAGGIAQHGLLVAELEVHAGQSILNHRRCRAIAALFRIPKSSYGGTA